MSSRSFSKGGIANPSDLKLLNGVFDKVCREFGIDKASGEAQDLGQTALMLFAAGIADEGQLTASLSEYVRRRIPGTASTLPVDTSQIPQVPPRLRSRP